MSETYFNPFLFSPHLQTNAMNELESQVVPSDGGGQKSTVYMDSVMTPVNQRGNPVAPKQTYMSASLGNGLHFSRGNWNQTMAVLVKRYDPNHSKKQPTVEDENFNRDLAKRFFLKFKCQAKIKMLKEGKIDEEQFSAVVEKFAEDIKLKKYYEQWVGSMNGGGETNARDIRFHLKEIFKPAVDFKDGSMWKVGQGISAWNVQLTSMIAFHTRFLQLLDDWTDETSGDYRCITDNAKSEDLFMKQVIAEITTKFNGQPLVKHLVDSEMFDASQGPKSRNLSKQYYYELGVSQWFVDWYFSLCDKAKLIGESFISQTDSKTSGQPLTLHENGVLTKLCEFHLVEVHGPQVLMYKGDDAVNVGVKCETSDERIEDIYKHVGLKMRAVIAPVAEFCGLLLTDRGLFPNLYRRLNKICAKRHRSYEDFTKYQESLRDFVKVVAQLGINDTIGATAFQKQIPFEIAEGMWHAIVSWSHINKEQFFEMMIVRQDQCLIPISAPGHDSGVRFGADV
jgi:hypothetical protein